MWCIRGELSEEYIEKMEDVLDTYEIPYNPKEPVICFDEKSVQLKDEVRESIPAKPGRVEKIDSEYKRCGTSNIFFVVEPKVGRHFSYVTPYRKGSDFAKVINRIAGCYPKAKKIHIVMDNLNTHKEKYLLQFYGEEIGHKIWSRFEIHYTPKHGSWLNQAEIQIGMFSAMCLGKRKISNIKTLRTETNSWKNYVNKKKIKIQWKFTTADARKKLKYGNP